jgi:hypothetical protein
MTTANRWLGRTAWTVAALVAAFALIQLVPYGRTHANPPITGEPAWDSQRTRELAVRACFDCHSNQTHWPRYANVAPMSWVVQYDVEVARDILNFSAWDRSYELAASSGRSVLTGNMPPAKYRMAHPEADLTPEETLALAHGLDATLTPARL